MEAQNLQVISSAVAPVVMVSAAGLLFMGVQSKNLHLADRIRAPMTEYRTLTSAPAEQERRQQIVRQLALFTQRVRLSQWALELLYIAMVCFVITSLLLAAGPWVGGVAMPVAIAVTFVLGVLVLLVALLLEFLEMRVGLKTIGIEIEGASRNRPEA